MNMKSRSLLRSTFLIAFVLGLAVVPAGDAVAQNQTPRPPVVDAPTYEVPTGPVTLYGQTLNPYFTFYEKDETYEGYRWDQLRVFVPQLLPDAKTKNFTSLQLCENILRLARGYTAEAEKVERRLALAMADKFPDAKSEAELVDEVGMRLASRDFKKTEELIKLKPEFEARIMITKEFAMKTKAMVMLHDAAMLQCQSYSKTNGFAPYLASYYLEKYGTKWPENNPQ